MSLRSTFLASFFLFLFFVPAISSNAASFAVQPSGTCIRVTDGGRQSSGQQVIRFYNGCTEDVYINACVKDDRGDAKLYKSSNRIQPNGNYTIYAAPFVYPRVVQWTSAPFKPAVPELCLMPDNSSKERNPHRSNVFNPRY